MDHVNQEICSDISWATGNFLNYVPDLILLVRGFCDYVNCFKYISKHTKKSKLYLLIEL